MPAGLVRHLGDRLDQIGLLSGDVEDLPGEGLHSSAETYLRARSGLERHLRPLELLELGELGEQYVGGVTEGLWVGHAG